MITFYTAVGRYEMRNGKNGNRHPVVILNHKEHILDLQEMIIWSSSMWMIHTLDELRAIFYKKEREAHMIGEASFEDYLDRLEKKGLIVSGRDYVGIDALYNLLSKLYIVPVTGGLATKVGAFFHLTFLRGIPFRVTKNIFRKDKLTNDEKLVLALSQQTLLSTAELIKCVHKGATDLTSNDKVMDTLYDDEITTCENIGIFSRFYAQQKPVLQAVSNLYLKKLIMFETL